MRMPSVRLLLVCLVVPLVGGLLTPDLARAEDEPATERARLSGIKGLKSDLRRRANSRRAVQHKEEILTMLEALEVLGGWEAGRAALEAVAMEDEEVRERAFALVDKEHHEKLVRPLAALLEDRRFRRDDDIRRRVARSLSIMADADAVPPLTELIRTDEDAHVVAAAADSLGTYASAPLNLRKDAVKRLIDVYTSTWNLMMSIRPEDKVQASRMKDQWEVYGRSVRSALQALTSEQLSRPQEWRRWWNDNKKRNDW